MKNDGLTFVVIVSAVIGISKLIWSHFRLISEIKELRKKLGKE